jgi:hypothetical protein
MKRKKEAEGKKEEKSDRWKERKTWGRKRRNIERQAEVVKERLVEENKDRWKEGKKVKDRERRKTGRR